MYRSLCQDDTGLAQEIDTQRTRRDLPKRKSKLLEYNVTGQITDADFLKMNRQCDEEIEQCSRCLAELEEQQNSRADLNAHIAEIRRVLREKPPAAIALNGLIGMICAHHVAHLCQRSIADNSAANQTFHQ